MRIRYAREMLFRALMLRCPSCGRGTLFKSLFRMHKACSECGLVFEREQGYFMGAIYINVMVTIGLILSVYLVSLFIIPVADSTIDPLLFAMAVILPPLLFRHARSLWLAFDHYVEPSLNRDKRH